MRRHSFAWFWEQWMRERREHNEWLAWIAMQFRVLEAGEEIDPPWVAWTSEDPWWSGWRQGNAEGWLKLVWLPFWSKLRRDEKEDYVEKWNARPEWRAYVLDGWDRSGDTEHKLGEYVLNRDRFISSAP